MYQKGIAQGSLPTIKRFAVLHCEVLKPLFIYRRLEDCKKEVLSREYRIEKAWGSLVPMLTWSMEDQGEDKAFEHRRVLSYRSRLLSWSRHESHGTEARNGMALTLVWS